MSDHDKVLGDDPLAWVGEDGPRQAEDKHSQSKGEIMDEEKSTSQAIVLPGQFTIAEVGQVHSQLLSTLKDCDEIVINGAQVSKADAASLQLIASLVATARENHMTLSWQAVSDELSQAVELAGLSCALGLE